MALNRHNRKSKTDETNYFNLVLQAKVFSNSRCGTLLSIKICFIDPSPQYFVSFSMWQ